MRMKYEEAIAEAKRQLLRQRKGRTALHVEVDTDDHDLAFDLMSRPELLGPGTSTEIPGYATLTVESLTMRKAFGFPETVELALSFGTGVASGLVANWLFAKLRGRTVSLRIERTEVQVNAGEIERIIRETIEQKE
jgi:hypothetical protein